MTALNAEIDDAVDKVFELSESPKKSEMPRNCKHEDTAQEKTLDEIVKESAEKVRDTNCIAVIIADEERARRTQKIMLNT